MAAQQPDMLEVMDKPTVEQTTQEAAQQPGQNAVQESTRQAQDVSQSGGVIEFSEDGLGAAVSDATLATSAKPVLTKGQTPATDPNAIVAGTSRTLQGAAKTLTYEDANLFVTVEAPVGVLPDGAYLEVEEINPVTQEKADAYAEALTSLSDTLRAEDKSYEKAKVYDIRVMNAGVEIEPSDQVSVSMSYKQPEPMGNQPEAVEIAHLTEAGDLEMMGADVAQDSSGELTSATFKTSSFSYYIVFGTNQGSDTEPIHFGDYGWLEFATPNSDSDWGHYQSDAELPSLNSEEGYHRILKVNLHTLKPGGIEGSYDDDNYDLRATNQYFWTWENSVYISGFYVPGYEVVQTKMHTAWDTDDADRGWQDSLVGNYSVRGYRSSDGTSSDLNVLDVYMKSVPTPEDAMRYIIRYVHADGSVTDGNVRYLSSGSTGALDVDKPRAGERFSGISVAAGVEAVTVDSTAKTVEFTYDPKVNLAKAYVYFEEEPVNNTVQAKDRYDKSNGKYYNGKKGLYTEKNAERIDDRNFLVNLEAWYVDDAASVGMVLDASGSMAWTAGVPTPFELSSEQLNKINNWQSHSSANNPLSLAEVNTLLDVDECDNTNNGYNGYKYYVYTKTVTDSNPINEYAALGYADNDAASNGTIRLGLSPNYKGTADTVNYTGSGWYFVNSGTDSGHYASYGAKRYQGLVNDYGYYGASRFYIKKGDPSVKGHEALDSNKYYLYCTFTQGSNNAAVNNQESAVFVKRDQMMTKAETLQDSIAQFGAILNGASPQSEMAMVRFSHTNFQQNLLLLNWTNQSEKISAAMNLTPNTAGGVARADGTYQYGITGGTKARFGFNEFNSSLKAHADSSGNYKYIVLFTDGKDQGTSEAEKTTKAWLNQTFPGYTIITMFMQSVGMSPSDVSASETFLTGLASGGKNGDPNEPLYFTARSDNANEIIDQFRQIARFIVTGLQDYSMRDYIDPRFDVVNDAGQVLSVLDENGEFKKATNPDVNDEGYRGFTTPDGKQALLGYDQTKKMFYVLWQHQDIQASPVAGSVDDGSSVTPWQSQIRLRAKEDFIGGNDVLTNGNSPTDNLVYKPDPNDPLKATTAQKTDRNGNPVTDSSGQPVAWEAASFPFASVNTGLLDVALGDYEDTIFLGETITPGDLLSQMADATDLSKAQERVDATHRPGDSVYDADRMAVLGDEDQSSIWYVEYLERLGKKLHDNPQFYATLLKHVNLTGAGGVQPLIDALKQNGNYTVADTSGTVTIQGKANTAAAGEKITIVKSGSNPKITLELPYYYLVSPTDPTTYAGPATAGTDPQDDKVGTLTYTWEVKTAEDFADNVPKADGANEENKFVQFDTYVDQNNHMDTTKPVTYQFKIDYVPATLASDAGNATSGDNGSDRTKALTGQTSVDQPLIRNVVGPESVPVAGEQNTTEQMGLAVIHAVDGRIAVQKRMLTVDYNKAIANMPDAKMTFTLTGKGIKDDGSDEVVWSQELQLADATATVDGDYTNLYYHEVTGLPQGDYELTETAENGLKLEKIDEQDPTFIPSETPANDPAQPYDANASDWKAATTGSGSTTLTFHIGKVESGTPASTSYTNTDYTYEVTKGDLATSQTPKNVDALQSVGNGKAYLNAQLGKALITNTIDTTSVAVTKVWDGLVPEGPIVAKLIGSDGTERYAVLNAANNWSHTFDKLDIGQTTYTVVEGIGTVREDGSCSDFFELSGKFVFDSKQYKQVSIEYDDVADSTGAKETEKVKANTSPLAGTATITNQSITKVAVEKVWEGVTPEAPIVVKLHGSDDVDYYTQLGTDSWTYTFEDLPAKPNLTYTAVEGTGTVGSDGTCADFNPFATSGTFTFDGKTFRLKSLKYFDAGSADVRAETNLDGSVSPDAGKAEFTNEALTKIEVEKAWADSVDDADRQPVYVQLYKSAASGEPEAVGDPVQLAPRAWSHAYENLKVEQGVTYSVKEGQLEGGVFVPYEGTFEMNGKKMHQESLDIYSDEAGTTKGDKLDGSVSPYGGKAVITNGLVLAKIRILKVEAANNDNTIDGVTFTLVRDANTPATGNPTYEKALDTQAVTGAENVVTADGGKLALPDLVPGAYWLCEVAVPAGYVMRDAEHPIGIVVDEEGAASLVPDTAVQGNLVPVLSGPDDGVYQLKVPNSRTYMLPGTGGFGDYPFLFVGAFLAVLAAGGYRTLRRPAVASSACSRTAHERR